MHTRGPLALLAALLCCLPALAFAQRYDRDGARERPGDFVVNRPVGLYAEPGADASIIRRIHARTVVHVVEVLDQWYRIRSTKGGPDGYIRRSYADPYAGGGGGAGPGRAPRFRAGLFKLTDPVVVRAEPRISSRKITTLRAGTELRVVDKDASKLWYKVESQSGRNPPGWIPTQAARRIGEAAH